MMNDQDLEQMQLGLAKLLRLKKHKKYPDGAMRILLQVYRDDVEIVHRTGELEDLRQPALGIYHAWKAGGPQEPSPQSGQIGERAAEQLGDYATERSKLFSECLAKLAAPEEAIILQSDDGPLKAYPEIKGFRVKYLGDKLLSPAQARALLTSPVAAHWSHHKFEKLRVPVVGHTYRVTEGMSDAKGPYSLVEVSPPSSEAESFEDRRPQIPASPPPTSLHDARSNAKPVRELRIGYPPRQRVWKILPYPGEDGLPHRVLVGQSSVLGDLHREASRLIQRYPWEEADAVWFMLTGKTPWVAPLTWQARWFGSGDEDEEDSFRYGFVTLKVEPWVDPKLVWKVYTDIQRGLRGGRRNRRLETKSLELLRFVNERVDVAGLSRAERRRVAPGLVAAWDKAHPDDAYDGNTREFWKAYHRARQVVMSPAYEWRGAG
jgi:hypothetical protein